MRKWKHFRLKAVIAAVSLSGALIAGSTLAWFTDTAEVAPTTFKAGTVDIEAGRTLDGPTGDFYYQTIPYSYHEHNQTTVEPGREVTGDPSEFILSRISERSLPGTRPTEEHYYSIGWSGKTNRAYVAVKLARPLDVTEKIRVIECSYGSPGDTENAYVYVSSDGQTWTKIATVSNKDEQPPVKDQHTSIIPIPDDAGTVNYIKFEDCSATPGGYDIDYLGVVLLNEGNWNPGDTNYIAYSVNNVGTKAIQLRAALSGVWQTYDEEFETWIVDTDMDTNNVIISLTDDNGSNWALRDDDGYYYYDGSLSGSYNDSTPGSAMLYLSVHLQGEETGNTYQGKRYVLTPTFQAIQNSHDAEWDWAEFDDYN